MAGSSESCVDTVVIVLSTDPEVRARFPALPDFLRTSGSATESTHLLSIIEELLERNGSGSGLENRGYGHRDPPR
jgi:hypothetical protein